MVLVSSRPVRTITLGGTPVRIADRQPTFWNKVASGQWEPHTLSAIAHEAHPGTVFIDIGAWIGVTTLLAAACGARVIALEPDPAAHAQFLANLDVNPDLAGRIEVLARALAPVDGPVVMAARRKPGDSMASTVFVGGDVTWTAPTITVTELVARLPSGSPLVIKIDIEGGEYELAGHLPALAAAQPCLILLSLHPAIFRATRGERALADACRLMAEAFRDFTAERAAGGEWHAEECFDPLIYRNGPSEWRLRPRLPGADQPRESLDATGRADDSALRTDFRQSAQEAP